MSTPFAQSVSTSLRAQEPISNNSANETYFGSKLVQALAEYSGRFRNEFALIDERASNESNAK